MAKHRLIAVLAMLTLVSGGLVGAAPQAAATGLCGSPHNYFGGYTGYVTLPASWNETPEGVSSYIVTRDGPVCANLAYDKTFSTSWIMLQSTGGQHKYAQAGFIFDGTCNRYYTEYNNGWGYGGFVRNVAFSTCVAYGSQHTYRVQYIGPVGPYPPPGGSLKMFTDGLTVNSGIDPWASGWSMIPTYSGETSDLANDIPGAAWAWVDVPAMGIQSVDTGTFRPTPCYLGHAAPGGPRYYAGSVACDHTYQWTDPF